MILIQLCVIDEQGRQCCASLILFSLSNPSRKGSNFHRFFSFVIKVFLNVTMGGRDWPTFYLQLFSRSALQTHQQKIALIWQAFQAAFWGEPGISWKLERQGFYTMRLLCWNQTKLSTTRLPLRNANYKYISSYLTLTYNLEQNHSLTLYSVLTRASRQSILQLNNKNSCT